jgi:hypothetical protein
MATLDETNIFGLPLTRQYGLEPKPAPAPMSEQEQANRQEFESRIGSDNKFGLTYEGFLKAKEKKLVSDQRMQVAQALAEGDTDKAYEGFTELPMVTDQFPAYMTPVLGNIIDEKERRYFAEKAGRELKDPRDVELEMLMASDPRDVKQFTTQDPVSGAMSTLAGVSSLIGIGEGPTMLKAGIMGAFPSLRRGMVAKSMDGQGGGGGGISNIQPQPTKDYAGFVSSVERAALGPQRFGTGQDLIKYLEAGRKGVSTKELEYIDFDQIRNNPDLTKEDVIAHIQANRPKVYRIERSEDNPTYQGDTSDHPLNELPYDQELSDDLNYEETSYWADEYGGDLEKQSDFILNNPVLESNGFVVNSENIKNPTVLADLESFIGRNPEAYSYIDRPLIKINYPDDRIGIEVTGSDLEGSSSFSFDSFKEVVEDGATLEFPTLKEDPFDIAQEAAELRMSPDFGGQYEVYEFVGDNTSYSYRITGNSDTGYQAYVDGEPVRGILGTTNGEVVYFDDLADARARVQAEAFDNGDIRESDNSIDYGSNANRMIDSLPSEVISGQATLRTRFGDEYSDYRLPMGGAENYREFTLHIENPKTATRYDSSKGTKHFGGGDELLHYRTTDRIDEDGKRVLFVEEIQSDLHSTASSTKSDATYEIGVDTKKKAVKELRDIFKDNNNLRVSDNGDIIKLDADSTYDTNGLLSAEEVANMNYFERLTDLSSNINLRKIGDLSDAEVSSLTKFKEKYAKDNKILPDLPYKGNDYIDLAVKDIMKLAAEGNYDRVAFTNPATQLRRNSKNLEYIDSIEINQVPFLTKAEQQFNEDWMRTRDRAMVSTMSPDSNVTETISGTNKMRLDGPLGDADRSSFVSVNTDFVVNNPQAQKFWQDFHKNQKIKSAENYETDVYNYEEGMGSLSENSGISYEDYMKFGSPDHRLNVDYIFSKADSPLTPAQVAEELEAIEIRRAKKQRLQETQEAIAKMQEATPMTNDEAYDGFLKIAENIAVGVEFPKKPFNQLTLDDMPLSPSELTRINQETRRGISYLMGEFRRNTLPNLDNAGKYLVKTKGTGYKVDRDKFMIERGEIQDNYKSEKYNDLDSMIEDLRLDKKTEEIVRKDAEKGLIPVSTKDKQIYQIEAEGGSGKKPALMYANLIPKSAAKFAQKYNKDAEAKLKKVLYEDQSYPNKDSTIDTIHQNYLDSLKQVTKGDDPYFAGLKTHEAKSIDITPEMRKAILTEGVNVMYKGGIVNKVKSMDKPIQGNRREM